MLKSASNFWSGIACLLLSVVLVVEGRDLGLGELREPDSGFVLFWVGVIMAALSAGLMIGAFMGTGRSSGDVAQPFGSRWRKIPLVLAYLVGYAVLLEAVGFIPLTLILLILLFKTVEPQSWTVAIVGAVATTAAVYVVFAMALGTQFPAGLLARG